MIIYFIGELINKFIPFLFIPIFTNLLTPDEMGDYVTFQTLLLFTNIIVCGGGTLKYSITFNSNDKVNFNISSYIYEAFLFSVTSLIIFLLLSYLLLNIPWFFILSIPISFFQLLISLKLIKFQFSNLRTKFIILQIILSLLVNIVPAIGLLFIDNTTSTRIAFIFLVYFSLFTYLILGVNFKKITFENTLLELLATFKLIPPQFFEFIKNQFDKIIILLLLTTSYLGNYSIVYQLTSIVYIVMVSYERAKLPEILNYSKDRKFINIFSIMLKQLLLGIIVLLCFYIVIPYIYVYFINQQYTFYSSVYWLLGISFILKSTSSILMKVYATSLLNNKMNYINLTSILLTMVFAFYFNDLQDIAVISLALVNVLYLILSLSYCFIINNEKKQNTCKNL